MRLSSSSTTFSSSVQLFLADVPSAPRKLNVTDYNRDRFTLQWEKPKSDGGAPLSGYVVQVCKLSDTDFVTVGRVDATITTFTVEDLKEGDKYYARVLAENPAGLSKSGAELKTPVVTRCPYGEFKSAFTPLVITDDLTLCCEVGILVKLCC